MTAISETYCWRGAVRSLVHALRLRRQKLALGRLDGPDAAALTRQLRAALDGLRLAQARERQRGSTPRAPRGRC